MSKTFRPYAPRQAFQLPPSPLEWLPEDHLALFILIVAEAPQLLRDRLNVSEAEFESLANLVLSQVDLNVSQVLHRQS